MEVITEISAAVWFTITSLHRPEKKLSCLAAADGPLPINLHALISVGLHGAVRAGRLYLAKVSAHFRYPRIASFKVSSRFHGWIRHDDYDDDDSDGEDGEGHTELIPIMHTSELA